MKLKAVCLVKGVPHLYLEGTIGKLDPDKEPELTAAAFREQLARCRGAKAIVIHFNSEGGVVTEGMAIYNALRAFPGHKTGIVDGIAASIASVILMGCDEIRVAKGGYVMIHSPSGGARGGASDLRSAADTLESMQGELLDIYESRTGIDRAQLEKLVNAETYFTAEEAVKVGLADSVETYEAHVSLQAVARLDPTKVPAALRALASKKKEKAMKGKNAKIKALEEQAAALKAMAAESDDDEPETDTEEEEAPEDSEEDDEEEEEPKDGAAGATALVAMVREVTGTKDIGLATAKLAGLLSAGAATLGVDRAKQVSALIKGGKLLPSLKSWAMKADPRAFKAYVSSVGGAQLLKLGPSHKPSKAHGEEIEEARPTSQVRPGADAESVIARQMGVDVAQVKKAPLPACVRRAGERGAQ